MLEGAEWQCRLCQRTSGELLVVFGVTNGLSIRKVLHHPLEGGDEAGGEEAADARLGGLDDPEQGALQHSFAPMDGADRTHY